MNFTQRLLSIIVLLGLTLGIHNGYIALWRGEEAEPYRVFPYKAALLPKTEQQLLERGIPIRDESHLHSLLEDYLS